MKKFLSLALALVMTMSLVTISAGATFTDDSTINYSEAVDVMTALEIVGGYANGSFGPEATLTRGAAAKIICNLIEGGDATDVVEGTYKTMLFSDVALNHTFADYIGYCANKGIISGYEDGTFRPAGTITGFAFMKMLLGALGYDSAVEGFTGDGWAVNVSSAAKKAKLDNGNEDYTGSKAMTREEACLYAFNTLKADIVEYKTAGTTITTTDGTVITTGGSTASKVEIEDDVYQTFMGEYYTKLDAAETTTDDFNRPATEWKYKGDVIGTYVDTTNLVASFEGEVSREDMYAKVGTKVVTYYVDGDDYNDEGEQLTKAADEDNDDAYCSTVKGSVTEVYLVEAEGAADTYIVVTINTYLVQATADYDADDEVLSVEGEVDTDLSIDDFAVSDFEEDDYILVTVADDKIQSVQAAEVVEGELTNYSSANKYATVDGTKYSFSAKYTNDGNVKPDEMGLVLDTQGYVIYSYAVTEADSDDFLFITDFGKTTSTGSKGAYDAAAYFADGTYAVIDLDEVNGEDIADLVATAGTTPEHLTVDNGGDSASIYTWYSYKENSDGTYDIDADVDSTTPYVAEENQSYTINGGKVNFLVKDTDTTNDTAGTAVSTVKGNSATVFVVEEDGDVYTYTGVSNMPSITSDVAVYVTGDTYAEYVYITATDITFDNDVNSVSDYVFVLNIDETYYDKAEDADITVFNAIVDGKVTTIEVHEDNVGDVNEYALYEELLADGDYDDVKTELADGDKDGDIKIGDIAITADTVADAMSYKNDVLALSADVDFIVVDETTIWDIDADGATAVSATKLAKTYDADETVAATYFAIVDGDDLLALYFVNPSSLAD